MKPTAANVVWAQLAVLVTLELMLFRLLRLMPPANSTYLILGAAIAMAACIPTCLAIMYLARRERE